MQHEEERHRQAPADQPQTTGSESTEQMSPGDEAPPGTPGTGENICPVCNGDGTVDGGECANCGGTGVVIEGVGGA